MHRVSRPAAAVAAAIVLLLAAPGRAELEVLKAKRAFLGATDESEVATFEAPAFLFAEGLELKGKGGCVLVRYSGELIGTDLNQNSLVPVSFGLEVESASTGEPFAVAPFPNLHQATTNILPQIVSFSAFACDLPPQRYNLLLHMQPVEEDDQASALFQTLEIWVEKGKRAEVVN